MAKSRIATAPRGFFQQDNLFASELGKFGRRHEACPTAADDNKVKRLLNLVLMQAIKDRASDIHFEPFEAEFKMRYRIDGVLYEMVPPPRYVSLALSSRIKVMSNLDIAERRLPQDGRVELLVKGAPIDLRVSVLPTMFGESVVLRVLDRSNVQLSLNKIGLRDDDLPLQYIHQYLGGGHAVRPSMERCNRLGQAPVLLNHPDSRPRWRWAGGDAGAQ